MLTSLSVAIALPICTKISSSHLPLSPSFHLYLSIYLSIASQTSLFLLFLLADVPAVVSKYTRAFVFIDSCELTRVFSFVSNTRYLVRELTPQPGDTTLFYVHVLVPSQSYPLSLCTARACVLVSTSLSHVSRHSRPRSTLLLTTDPLTLPVLAHTRFLV